MKTIFAASLALLHLSTYTGPLTILLYLIRVLSFSSHNLEVTDSYN